MEGNCGFHDDYPACVCGFMMAAKHVSRIQQSRIREK